MESTQPLECTQPGVSNSQVQQTSDEQIAFLGMCGNKYPIYFGSNKIGRNPDECKIVLDKKSLSRTHAEIFVDYNKKYILRDLKSTCKTKLGLITLVPYEAYYLSKGDTIQFGDIFATFDLLDDDSDLPMTQDVDLPETPIHHRFMTRLGHNAQSTTIPESPDVSDKDDSYIASSQHTSAPHFKNSQTHFIKPSNNTINRPIIGCNKIDNVYWNSLKKSPSIKLLNESDTFNNSSTSMNLGKTVANNNESKCADIHEMETQQALHETNESTDAIRTKDTQLNAIINSPLPLKAAENLPAVKKNTDQLDFRFEFSALRSNKIDDSIHSAETQNDGSAVEDLETQDFFDKGITDLQCVQTQPSVKEESIHDVNTQNITSASVNVNVFSANKAFDVSVSEIYDKDSPEHLPVSQNSIKSQIIINESDEEILFEEIDGQIDDAGSQPLLPLKNNDKTKTEEKENIIPTNIEDSKKVHLKLNVRNISRKKSDSSSDSDDITTLATQKISENEITVADLSDVEDIFCDDKDPIEGSSFNKPTHILDYVSFEEMPTQIIEEDKPVNKTSEHDISLEKIGTLIIKDHEQSKEHLKEFKNKLSFDEIATKIIEDFVPVTMPLEKDIGFDRLATDIEHEEHLKQKDVSFEEMATQIIEVTPHKENFNLDEIALEDMATQILQENIEEVKTSTPNVNIIELVQNITSKDIGTRIHDSNKHSLFRTEKNESAFKVPKLSAKKAKKNHMTSSISKNKSPRKETILDDQIKPTTSTPKTNHFYNATQEIYNDLCSQKQENATQSDQKEENKSVPSTSKKNDHNHYYPATQDIVNDLLTQRELSPIILRKPENDDVLSFNANFVQHNTSKLCDSDENNIKDVSELSLTQICDVVGADRALFNKVQNKYSMGLSNHEEMSKIPDDNNKIVLPSNQKDVVPRLQEQSNKVNSKKNVKVKLSQLFYADTSTSQKRPAICKKVKNNASDVIDISVMTKQKSGSVEKNASEEVECRKSKEKKNCAKPTILSEHSSTKDINSSLTKSIDLKKTRRSTRSCKNKHEYKRETQLSVSSEKEESKHKSLSRRKKKSSDEKNTQHDQELKTKSKSSKSMEKKGNRKQSPPVHKESKSKQDCGGPKSKKSLDLQNINSPKKSQSPKRTRSMKTNYLPKGVSDESDRSKKRAGKSSIETTPTKDTASKKARHLSNIELQEPPKRTHRTRSKTTEKHKETGRTRSKEHNSTKDIHRTRSKNTDKSTEEHKSSAVKKTEASYTDISTVYSMTISSESSPVQSPKRSKKRAKSTDDDPMEPRSKKIKPSVTNSSKPSKLNPNNLKTQYVLCTAFRVAEVMDKLESLGALVAKDVASCTVVLTKQIKRTVKLLCAVGLGKPIVGPDWVQACVDSNCVVDPWLYILKDDSSEGRYNFSLQRTLTSRVQFLKGYNVTCTPQTLPCEEEMRLIVECSGGKWHAGGARWLCVSCVADKHLWPALKGQGAIVVNTELVLGGALRQKLDIKAYTLFE